MIDLSAFTPQLHAANWGWTIALFLWLIGLSGMGFFLNYWIRQKNFVYLLTLAGLAGTGLVTSHLGRLTHLPTVMITALTEMSFNFQSWMLIGISLLSILCIGSVIYSLAFAGIIFKGDFWQRTIRSNWFNALFAALGVFSTIYSGFLLTQAVGISLWNTSLIPLLWIMSGLATALGSIELFSVFGWIDSRKVPWLQKTTFWVELCEIFTIFAFVYVAFYSTVTAARAGAQALLTGPQSAMFWGGVIACGFLVPFLVNLFTKNHKVLAVGAICAVFGALFLRASVLFSGYYDSILF